MPTETPFYQRTLDSFADEIITFVRQSEDSGLWYAVLDTGPKPWPGDPDFSTCAKTQEEAVRLCAQKIRDDARGIGKFAPHAILTPSYDLTFRLMRHWSVKEKA